MYSLRSVLLSPVQRVNRELKMLRQQLQRKRHIKIELCVNFSLLLVTLYKIGGVHFRLLGTNGFHVKAKNESLTAASSRCRQNLKYENFTWPFGRLRQNIAPKKKAYHMCSAIVFLHSLICGVSLTLPSSNLKLANES